MIVGVEATSLIGPRSGVGYTAASVVEALVRIDEGLEVVLLPVTVRGAGRPRHEQFGDHPRIRVARARLPARVVAKVWSRADWPPAELFCGSVDVFWGPNFLLPPLVRAAGVVTIHDLAFVHMPSMCSDHVRSYVDMVPRMAARANRIIVPSRFVADQLAAWLPQEKERIRVVHPGVRRAFRERGGSLTPPRRDALGIGSRYVAYVGNLELRKNLDVLLQSFALVHRLDPTAQLVLIGGPGVGWDAIRARHASILEGDAVRVVGYLPDPEVAAIVRGARAFVYPSRYEGFGIPPLEAMACGVPVIAAKGSALPEALGDHAHLVDPDDIDALAVAIVERMDPGYAEDEPIEAARAWASGFTWGRAANETLDVFAEATSELRS